MTRPCPCDRIDRGRAFDPARHCRPCWLYEHDQRYRDRWGGTGKATPAPRTPTAAAPGRFALACSLRGDATGETRPCKTCGGVRDVPLYACPVHGVCTA